MLNEIKQDAESRMKKSVESMLNDFSKMRTGRANPALLDSLTVDYYGTETPLNQVASVSVSDARTLMVTPWEKNMVPVVEKAIIDSDLGLNPATSSNGIRVPMPPLSEERRKDMIKLVRNEAENGRISVRNIRRDANNSLKDLLKDKEITEDEERRGQDAIQKLTDKFVSEIDEHLQAKEADLMEI